MKKQTQWLCLLLFSFPIFAFGQTTKDTQVHLRERIAEVIREKLKISPQQLLELQRATIQQSIHQKQHANTSPAVQLRDGEVQISTDEKAESEVHAAINPTDSANIIVSAMRNDPENFTAPLEFPVFYTHNFGASWQQSSFTGTPTGQNAILAGGGDPIIVFDSNGKAYLSWLTLSINLTDFSGQIALRLATSTNGGQSWVEAAQPIDFGTITNIITFDADKFVDKEWMAVDRTNLATKDNIYIAYVVINTNPEGYRVVVRKKSPTLNNFGAAVPVSNANFSLAQFASIDVDAQGVVHVLFMATADDNSFALYHTKSTDGGTTFSAENKISDIRVDGMLEVGNHNIVGIDTARMYPCPHLRADLSSGYLFATWTANGISTSVTSGKDIYFSSSGDGGITWSPATVLNDDGNPDTHQFYSSMAVSNNGKVVVSWYDRRDDAQNLETNYYMTVSNDAGETWLPNVKVSTQPSNFSAIGQSNGNFGIGEYTQVVTTNHVAIPIWADGRTNNGDIDLYAAFLNLDGSVSVKDISHINSGLQVETLQPNPTKDNITLSFSLIQAAKVKIAIYSTDGKLMTTAMDKNFQAGKQQASISVSTLPQGNYVCRLQSPIGDKAVSFSKF
ncbi:MAG: T9SS type A sorting domain-containing protein [Saprospiraceae bacterium]|nr:T9SS type A sorting domain-containing protein [Saprospiraceae bacterium]MBP7699520.1 T9SS type A sorting domain-containing protein [Saprospiraceae bacterium]